MVFILFAPAAEGELLCRVSVLGKGRKGVGEGGELRER